MIFGEYHRQCCLQSDNGFTYIAVEATLVAGVADSVVEYDRVNAPQPFTQQSMKVTSTLASSDSVFVSR